MKRGDITFTAAIAKEINALKNRKVDLTDKDAPEITNWENTVVGKFYRPLKKQITIRIDADVLDWFRHTGAKYQSLMNRACREYMEQHVHAKKATKHKSDHHHAR